MQICHRFTTIGEIFSQTISLVSDTHLSIRTILKLIYYWTIFLKATIAAIKNDCRIEHDQTVQNFQWAVLAHFIGIGAGKYV